MTISKNGLFVVALILVLTPFLIPKIVWLSQSKTANGTMRFVGKSYTGQLIHFYSVVSFPAASDTFWFNSNDNTIYEVGQKVPVRYQEKDPADAKVNIFSNVWSDTVVYGAGPLILLLFIFFHPRGIPRQLKLILRKRRPFIQIG